MTRLARLLACFVVIFIGLATAAFAQSRVLRIWVGFPAGQATDLVARLIAERLQVALGHPVIVENRPGQGGSFVLGQLAAAPPDGTAMVIGALAAFTVNPHLYKVVNYDTLRDFAPVGLIADLPLVMVVHPSVSARTLPELVAHARANPGRLTHSSSGIGTLSHLGMEHFKRSADIDITHVPYRGSAPAMTDLIGGRIDVALETMAVTLPHVDAGRARLLAVGARARLPERPDTPTIAEQGYPGFDATAWIGAVYPRGTPEDIVSRTSDALAAIVRDPAMRERFTAVGALPRPSSPQEFATHIAAEHERWGEVVRRSGIERE